MKKIFVLTAVFLLAAGMGTAADRHGPMKTGLFEVQIDDVEVKGWQSVTIPGKSIEQDSYREGNDASHEKKTWGQVSFDDLEMERGVKPGATELHDWIKDIQAGKADSARKEIAVKIETENGKDVDIVKEKKKLAGGGGKTVGAGQVTEILELAGNDEQERGLTIAMYAIKNGGIDPETVDDIQAGKADEGRKEIAVKIQDEDGAMVATFKPGKNLAEAVK